MASSGNSSAGVAALSPRVRGGPRRVEGVQLESSEAAERAKTNELDADEQRRVLKSRGGVPVRGFSGSPGRMVGGDLPSLGRLPLAVPFREPAKGEI